MHDIIIIGKGPAGISAALYGCRANLSVIVIGKDNGSLAKAGNIENYYGFDTPISGTALWQKVWQQA
jgi:thioredoxin reductase (NADPH)